MSWPLSWLRGVRQPTRPDPEPLEIGGIPFVAAGTALWAIGLVVLLVARTGGAEVHTWWMTMCGYGVGLGLLGIVSLRRQERRRR